VARCYYTNFTWSFEHIIPPGQSYLTSGVTIGNKIYCGAERDGFYSVLTESDHAVNNLTPDGPLSNNVFVLKIDSNNQMWTVFGGYNSEFNPYLHTTGLSAFGINRLNLNSSVWQSITYEQIAPFRATSHIEEHPLTKDIYISSFHDGLMKITPNANNLEESTWTVYNHQNTGSDGIEAYEQTTGRSEEHTSE